jgi:hypothetical protein
LAAVTFADFSAGLLAPAAAARCGRDAAFASVFADEAGVFLAAEAAGLLAVAAGAVLLPEALPEGVFDAACTEAPDEFFADAAPAVTVFADESGAAADAVAFALDADGLSDLAGTFFGVVTIVPSSIYEFQDSHIDVAMQQNLRWKRVKRQGYFRDIEFTKHPAREIPLKNKRAGKCQPVYILFY